MASVTKYLELLLELTQKNLDILNGLNQAFMTKNDHLNVVVDSTKYVIPSFMSLENKINNLQENFYNLVHAPETGEAYFNFDGNSRSIEVRGYTQTPNSLKLKSVKEFNVEVNNIFKDFLTPNPYIHFNVSELPDDITSVVIKKIIPKHPDLISLFSGSLIVKEGDEIIENNESIPYSYKDLYKILSIYNKDIDYTEYDSTIKLPIRKNVGTGNYVVEKVLKDITDLNLDQYVTVKIREDLPTDEYMNKLYYRLFDETIERPLQIGDELTSYDGKTKLTVFEIRGNSNTMVLHVTNGEYLNIDGCGSVEKDLITPASILKFFTPADFNDDKVVKVPLEEDKYIYVAIAPLNDRMNIRAPWGTGLMINTFILNKLGSTDKFETYYKNNIKNIGDTLNEISSLTYNTITKFNETEFNTFTKSKPVLKPTDVIVTQINKHLNNSKTIQEIRSLYSQKLKYNTELQEIQTDIDNYNKQLAETSFDDIVDTRASITAQLNALNKRKNELVTSITKIINDIAMTANNSDVPIENAKYRVRGFFDFNKFMEDNNIAKYKDNVIGMVVRYRYKNQAQPQGDALSINGYVFSDWNDVYSPLRIKHPDYVDGYKFEQNVDNSDKNEPSFNQIDIPITQSETVDIKVKLLYDFGYPFINTYTEWSDPLNVSFPKELSKDVQIITILEENNNDIETNRFTNILQEEGIPEHILDKITDQDITYYHKPENISSGFYTAERRIIPLKDKLNEFDSNISAILSELNGDTAAGIQATIEYGGRSQELFAFQDNNVIVESYNSFTLKEGGKASSKDQLQEGGYTVDGDVVSVVLNIKLTNISNRLTKLYPLFPGDRGTILNEVNQSRYSIMDYAVKDRDSKSGVYPGIYLMKPEIDGQSDTQLQTANQFLTFRLNNLTTGKAYYIAEDKDVYDRNDLQTALPFEQPGGIDLHLGQHRFGAVLYPYIKDDFALCVKSNSPYSYLPLAPKESVTIPIIFEYNLSDKLRPTVDNISKVVAFDVRTSLYSEPTNFNIRVVAKRDNSTLDRIDITDKQANVVKYNTVVAN